MNEPYISTKDLWDRVGGLGIPSKMPCYTFSISARKCQTGGKLHSVPNSVCNKCYAFRGNYNWPGIVNAFVKRQDIMENDPQWVSNMIELINRKGQSYFRWFDSGDLQSVSMLSNIVEIAKQTPNVKHWLPTKEYPYVTQYIKAGNKIPSNLIIRLSGFMIDGPAPKTLAKRLGVHVSSVTRIDSKITCPASKQDNECGSCRNCWDKNVKEIIYKYH